MLIAELRGTIVTIRAEALTDNYFEEFQQIDFTGKTVAVFGLGDQIGYSEYFVDGIGILAKVVLENGYGCEIELVPGATMPTATSMMEKGEPDVAPELWINAVRTALDAATAEGRLHYAAEVFSDTGEEGWWIPQYIADANPEIQTVSDALARPDLFPHPEGDGGGLYTCPSGWNCQLSTGNLFRAFGGEEAGFRILAIKKVHLSKERAGAFYAIHSERPFYNELVEFDEFSIHELTNYNLTKQKNNNATKKILIKNKNPRNIFKKINYSFNDNLIDKFSSYKLEF